jgi:hypothetical protein
MEGLERIYLNHCSGEMAIGHLEHVLGRDVVRRCPAGTWLDLRAGEGSE